ncbi:MAG: efflux RND transporter periplasmic adaptor subunit [Cytophagaceae bacterium]|nr:efflux RND transporter periplasmic adaptor subunit [Cytophagaceae bacterium]
MKKFTKTTLTLLVLLLILGLVFYPRLKPLFNAKTTDQVAVIGEAPNGKGAAGGSAAGGKTTVRIIVVQPQTLNDVVKTTGTVRANEEVELHSEVSGKIIQLSLHEGNFVRQGTVLLRTSDDELQAQLRKLGNQKRLAQGIEDRQRRLLAKEAISQQEYDISLTNVQSFDADIENVKAMIAKTILKAPFDGTVGLRFVSTGSYISPASQIATLTNTNPAKLDFSVPAKYASAVRKGSRVQFTVEDSRQTHTGTVYAIDPKIDPQTRTLQLRATSPNPGRVLIPGSFAKIDVVLSSKANAILVPTEAVIPELNGHKVFLVKNGKAVPRTVELGLRGDKEVEVSKGVSVGDTIITNGILQVKPNGAVEVEKIRN